jgi:hypothetical protein
MKQVTSLLALGILVFFTATNILAQSPRDINYQGILLDAAKNPMTGIHQITVKLYDAPHEGTVLHSETFTTQIENGIFNVVLGSETAFEASLAFDKQYWIGVSVDDAAELSPRTALTSIPYAFHADAASSLTKNAQGAVLKLNGRTGNLTLKGGVGTVVQTEGNTITIDAIPIIIQDPQVNNTVAGTANQVFVNGLTAAQPLPVTLSLPQDINSGASPTFHGMTLSSLSTTGVVHNNSSGVLSTSLVIDADVSSIAAISDTKLATISTSGKVANSATTAASSNTANTIVLRDGSGNFSAGTITADLTGDASGTSSNVTGIVTEAHGGTNQSTYAAGDLIYASAPNTLAKLGIGSSGKVLTVSGGLPSWHALAPADLNSSAWILSGNTGTSYGTNFIGTTDYQSLQFRTNNQPSGLIQVPDNLNDGSTGLGYQVLMSNTTGHGNTAFGFTALTSNTTGFWNVALGDGALDLNTTGSYNTAAGTGSLFSNTTGSFNTAAGDGALLLNTTGSQNSAAGGLSLFSNTTGSNNTAAGYQSLYSNTTSNQNTAIGYQALYSNTIGNGTAIGFRSLFRNTTGIQNTAIGDQSLFLNTTGSYNTASGLSALFNNSSGGYNTADGNQSLNSNTTGSYNTSSGYSSLWWNETGSFNTASGSNALYYNTGSDNTAEGSQSLQNNTTGAGNTALGKNAGFTNRTGSNNTFLGLGADASANNLSNATAIGAGTIVSASNSLILGNNANVGIGTSAPDTKLDVEGDIHASGVIASGASIVIDGSSTPRTISSDDAVDVTTTSGDISFSPAPNQKVTINAGTLIHELGHTIGLDHGGVSLSGGDLGISASDPGYSVHFITNGGDFTWYDDEGIYSVMRLAAGGSLTVGGIGNSGNVTLSDAAGNPGGEINVSTTSGLNVASDNAVDIRGGSQHVIVDDQGITVSGSPTEQINSDNDLVINVGGTRVEKVSSDGSVTIGTAGTKGKLILWDDPPNYHTGTLLTAANLSAEQTYTFPDKSGTVALTTDISSSFWSLAGNSGTTPGTNFIGTTDNQDVVFKANATERIRLRTDGGIDLPLTTGANVGVIMKGGSRFIHEFGVFNTFVGRNAGNFNSGIRFNTGYGEAALQSVVAGGEGNVGIGDQALLSNTTGGANTAVGSSALRNNTTAIGNTAVGYLALYSNVTGSGNTAVGEASLLTNTGFNNTALGFATLQNNTTASNNTALGIQALYGNTTGNNNTASGYLALENNTSGGSNTAFGYNAGLTNTTGASNTLLGSGADVSANNLSNATAIGAGAIVSASNSIVLGNNANVGIGISAPAQKLDVNGRVRIENLPVNADDNLVTANASGDLSVRSASSLITPAWSLSGNAGTSYGTNFIGTTDGEDLQIRVRNFQAGVIEGGGNINTGLGFQVLSSNTSGNSNVAIGYQALAANTSGTFNASSGYLSLSSNTTGNSNTAYGSYTLVSNITSAGNTAIGYGSLYFNIGTFNSGVGVDALYSNTSGNTNTAFGYLSLFQNSTGDNNTGCGRNAGVSNTTGSSNTFLGSTADASVGNLTNATAIGANAFVGQSNSVVIGSIVGVNGAIANAKVGIGTSTPRTELDVVGTGGIVVPVGTTAQRPAAPAQGTIRFNTTTAKFEGYDGTAWVNLN